MSAKDLYRGASEVEILHEPDWKHTHSHRVGVRGRDSRFMGYTHAGDEWYQGLEAEAQARLNELREKVSHGELVTVRDIMGKQKDFHLERPGVHPSFWRYVLHTTESFIKLQQPWPINLKRRGEEQKRKEEEQKKKEEQENELREQIYQQGEKAKQDHPADAEHKQQENQDHEEQGDSAAQLLPEEQALLDFLRHEQISRSAMTRNDGQGLSPLHGEQLPEQIDEADQFYPDSWIPRSDQLIRLTGKHPLNAEVELTTLFDAGLVTPAPIHYVRNHGPVPHLLWENHKLEVTAGKKLIFDMDQLKKQFDSINIPILIACDGARRKELNMIRKTKAFNYTAAAAGCSYWKGVLLRDVLLQASVNQLVEDRPGKRFFVHYEGADDLAEGKYATSVPLEYVMDIVNDVMLAYEMNDHPIPPDHGYPLRLILPGWVGARSIKWLAKIWVSDQVNESYYHIYDNRQLPSFVTDTQSDIAQAMFHHPSTLCNEQMLNSVVVRPAQDETISLVDVKRGKMYRVTGYAYNGGGNEIDRVEMSLDGGNNWLYCIRNYPEAPIRHGKRFWTWLHWHVDVEVARLVRAQSILVRAFDSHKNTQPPKPVWNIAGMMNNCWYEVKPEVFENDESKEAYLLFRHPVDAGNGVNGWMKPSYEERIEEVKRTASAPERQFTRQEIEKHHAEDDCWIVVNGNVYDATSVLDWHPGGKGAILAHAGAAYFDTTEDFENIHDDFAHDKLKECILGKVTKKTMEFMKADADRKRKEREQAGDLNPDVALDTHKWIQVRLTRKKTESEDSHRYTFSLPPPAKRLGLETGQHIQVGFHFRDRLVARPYTPVRPVVPEEEDGTFDLVVKTYYPDVNQPGGTMSNIFDCLRDGEEIEVKGPSGDIRYRGNGRFVIDEREYIFDNISLILGGSGITPGYQVIAKILKDTTDKTKIKVIDANKTEDDILMRGDFDDWSAEYKDRFEIVHVLERPSEEWTGLRGFVNEAIFKEHAFEPAEHNIALLCGPPMMTRKAVLPSLKRWGYEEDRNLFGF